MTLKEIMAADQTTVFFNTFDFGQRCLYTPKDGDPIEITIGFHRGSVLVDSKLRAAVETQATAALQRSEVVNPQYGDTFTLPDANGLFDNGEVWTMPGDGIQSASELTWLVELRKELQPTFGVRNR